MHLRDTDYEALAESYRRLRRAAQAVVDASRYPADGDEGRVYESQLRDLARELRGDPQPTNRLTWMSPT